MVPLVGPGYRPTDRDEQGLWQQMERVEEEIAGSNLLIKDPALTGYLGDLRTLAGAEQMIERLLGRMKPGLAVRRAQSTQTPQEPR